LRSETLLYQAAHPRCGEGPHEHLADARAAHRRRGRGVDPGSEDGSVADATRQLAEHATGGGARGERAGVVEDHGADGIDVLGLAEAFVGQGSVGACPFPPSPLFGGGIGQLLEVRPQDARSGSRYEDVGCLVQDPAGERDRMPYGYPSYTGATTGGAVGDPRVQLQFSVPVQGRPVAGVEFGVVLERLDGRDQEVEPVACTGGRGVGKSRDLVPRQSRDPSMHHNDRHPGNLTLASTMWAMSIYVVSDLHGAVDPLRKAVPEGATLLLLGDLLNVIDYLEMSGIIVEVFGEEAVSYVNKLRMDGDFVEARRVMRDRSAGREEEIRDHFITRQQEQYEEVFAALPDPTYLILGNVDVPPMAERYADRTPGVVWAESQRFDIGGESFGFVGGALPTPLHVAGEITDEEMRARIDSIGEVDVLCTHIPPSVPELCYDTLAGRAERGSDDLLEYIMDVQPRRHYFGHVHQPLVSSMRVGRTLCINAGYFRATKRAFPHS
jgi:Icc-related predicted phosphoesterase